jgi:hypothetical protein
VTASTIAMLNDTCGNLIQLTQLTRYVCFYRRDKSIRDVLAFVSACERRECRLGSAHLFTEINDFEVGDRCVFGCPSCA